MTGMINGNAQPIPGWDGGDADSAYLDKTLRPQGADRPIDFSLGDQVTGRTVARVVARAAAATGVVALVELPLLLPVRSVTSLLLLMYLTPLLFLLTLLFSPLTDPVGEWRVLLRDRTDVEIESTYQRICAALARTFPHPVTQHGYGRLLLRAGDCRAVISVFRYGDGLCLGWQMARTRRGWWLIGRFLADVLGGPFGWSELSWSMRRPEYARAMREAVHAACREGLRTAIEREFVGPPSFAVSSPGSAAVPMPAPAPVPPQPSTPPTAAAR